MYHHSAQNQANHAGKKITCLADVTKSISVKSLDRGAILVLALGAVTPRYAPNFTHTHTQTHKTERENYQQKREVMTIDQSCYRIN